MILLASLSLSLRWSQPVKYLARSPPGKKIEENKNNIEIALRDNVLVCMIKLNRFVRNKQSQWLCSIVTNQTMGLYTHACISK